MKEHLKIISQFDQLPLDVIIMSPSHPKGMIQISHGMCEHKERYEDFMKFMCQHGFLCLIHDHRGHGKSIKEKNDLGYFYENGHIGIVEDVHQLTTWIKSQHPDLPLYLFGHSMGSLVVRCYLKKYEKDIDGLIVCGSPSYNSQVDLGLAFARLISSIKGDHYRSKLIQKTGFDIFNKKFDKHTPNSWICSDTNVVEAYNKDPLCHFSFTVNGFYSLFMLMKETYSSQGYHLNNEKLPILFVSGQNDPCLNTEKHFHQAVLCLEKQGYQNIKSHLFSHMRHEILNEKNKKEVYQYIFKEITSW